MMLAGCEVICNFAQARIAQSSDGGQHVPVVAYQSGDTTSVLIPRDAAATTNVTQINIEDEEWVITAAADIGEDWQRSTVLDVVRPR
jgi:hypothetical protein